MLFLIIPMSLTAKKVKSKEIERSFWIDIDLRHNNGRGYWRNVEDLREDRLPIEVEIENACHALSQQYHGNKLYVVYHRQFEISGAKESFLLWEKYGKKFGLIIVPTLVLESYAKVEKLNFSNAELLSLVQWCLTEINSKELGIYDVYIRHGKGSRQDHQLSHLRKHIGNHLVRVGLQPGEMLNENMIAGVEDTWTAECQGITNDLWEFPKTVSGNERYGRALLEQWLLERIKGEERRIVWNKIPVAWDYDDPVDSYGYVCPGDDALINDPPIPGRLTLCDKYIQNYFKKHHAEHKFHGYSCDLHILEANSYGKPEEPSFYTCLRNGKPYKGYFAGAMNELGEIYLKYKVKHVINDK